MLAGPAVEVVTGGVGRVGIGEHHDVRRLRGVGNTSLLIALVLGAKLGAVNLSHL